MKKKEHFIPLDTNTPIWDHFFTVSPLVVIGSKENEGYDLAPKHMVTAMGHSNYFGFVCTPRHATYRNIKREKAFTVSYPKPEQVVLASLAASPRCDMGKAEKMVIGSLPTIFAKQVDALFIRDAYLYFECELFKIIDGFDDFSLITGKIIGAYVHEDAKRISEKDEQQMIFDNPLLAYLAYGRFAEIKHSLAFPFPKDFMK